MLHMHIHKDKTKSVLFGTFERFSLQNDDLRIELQEKCDISVSTYTAKNHFLILRKKTCLRKFS